MAQLTQQEQKEIEQWVSKSSQIRDGADLSRDEDLSIAIMNLISLEEHFYFTAMKTSNKDYLEMLNSVRELRKSMLAKIVKNPQGEEWCISKHLLASSMRLMEVGTKELAKSNTKEANIFFRSAFNLYSLFFAINLKMTDTKKLGRFDSGIKETDDEINNIEKQGPNDDVLNNSNKNNLMRKFSEIVKKIVDCCKE